jgi:WD40 repeat protein
VAFSADREGIVEENIKFDHLVMPFHTEPITGIDVCIRKPLIATCSSDRSIRIWNYVEPQLEILKEFEEEVYAVAFHQSGFHLIAAFNDRILMFNIFEHDLVSFKEIHIKACREIKFSNGGHLFAIANSNIV